MHIRPLNHRVLCKRCIPSTKTAGGIVIPETSITKHQECEVLEVGPGKLLESGDRAPMSVQKGDHILVFRGHEITLEGQEYLFVNDEDVLGVVTRPAS